MADSPAKVRVPSIGESVDFHYQKSPDYRAIHCDGAYGGITPRGYINFTLYNERNAVPRKIVRKVVSALGEDAFELGPDEVADTLGGIMRQMEVTVFMDLPAAKEFLEWLGTRVRDLEQMYAAGLPQGVARQPQTGDKE